MANNIITAFELFVLILAILNVFKNAFNVFKVMRLKEGTISLETPSLVILGASISYIITAIILGF